MKLIVQPDDDLVPVISAVKRAKRTIDLVMFRFDRLDLEKSLAAAVARGVVVRVLVAYTNGRGEKLLRKLEHRMLEVGVTVTRTADDLPRYHGKMVLIDDALFVLGFNYTKRDIERSRSFGIITHDKKLLKEAASLFEADSTRQAYKPGDDRLVVSPETSRERLTAFIGKARKQLLIYDERISDKLILRLMRERIGAGVEIRVIGRVEKNVDGVATAKLSDLRQHVRAIVRDGNSVFLGSQSLRKIELDKRREIGIIVNDTRVANKMRAVFEADWNLAKGTNKAAESAKAEAPTEEAAAG